MKLIDLQRKMLAEVIRAPGKVSGAEYMKPNDRLTARERLGIYNQQYWLRLTESFADDFPGLRVVLGSRAFRKLSNAYLGTCPSRSFTLRDLGQSLEAWLALNPVYAGDRLEFALDMVRLEWAHIESFDSRDAKPLGPEDLAELNPNLALGLQPHIRLLALHYPVDDVRLRTLSVRAAAARGRVPIFLATHRVEGDVFYRRLEAAEFELLQALATGAPLIKALQAGEPAPRDLQRWFAVWSQLGWLTRSSARSRGRRRTDPSSPYSSKSASSSA